MPKSKINLPFFTVSPKSYLVGENLLELALLTDKYAKEHEVTIFFSAPPTELNNIVQHTNHVIVTAQAADGSGLGRGMGRTLMEGLKELGVKATFLNHMENQLSLKELCQAISSAKKAGIITIVCANSTDEARAIAILDPDIVLCEPDDLVGTGKTSPDSYIFETLNAVREVNKNILIMEGAGITCGDDVRRLIKLGAQGTGISSKLALTEHKEALLKDLFSALSESKSLIS